MRMVDLAGGGGRVTFDEAVAFDQQRETRAVPYGTQAGVAPVTAAQCSWAAEGPITVAITLPAPVCGLGECQGLPFWFSHVRPRPLLTSDWQDPPQPDAALCVQDGVL